MKFKIVRSAFMEGLNKVQNVASSKNALTIYQNILFETNDQTVTLTATDLNITIITTVPAQIIEEGKTTLPARTIYEIAAKSPEGPIEIDVDAKDVAHISAGSAEFNLEGFPAEDFINPAHDITAFEYVVQQPVLREMFRKTAFAALLNEEDKAATRGVLIKFSKGELTMVGTNGRCLAIVQNQVEVPENEETEKVLPISVLGELQRMLTASGDVRIKMERTQISFNMGNTRLYSKLIDQVYPNYMVAVPEPESLKENITIDRQQWILALNRVKVFAQTITETIRIQFHANQLIVMTSHLDKNSARDVVPIKYDGPLKTFSFDAKYLLNPLKVIDEDEVVFSYGDFPQAQITCSVPFRCIVMPLNVE